MKTVKITLALFLFVFALQSINGQEFAAAIYYLQGEKSKDSHSSEESIAIGGDVVAYSIKYSGRRGKNDKDTEKSCIFTEQDIKNIKETIIAKGLNKSDSLFEKDSKSKSFEIYTNISISIAMDGNEYKIRINGDVSQFKDSDLYNNSVYLITMIRNLVKNCREM